MQDKFKRIAISTCVSHYKENTMPAKRVYKGAAQKLRARYHDYNSQRRHRNKSTVTWEAYKKATRGGKVKLKTRK